MFNPRLTDYHGIQLAQADVDFAIPFFDEDIPLYVDPFLLWKSPSFQDKALHSALVNSFNNLGYLAKNKRSDEAIRQLVLSSECDEVGLGVSKSRKGKRIGKNKAAEIVSLFELIPEYHRNGFRHFEEIQFYVDSISKDRICDISCSFLKSFLIDFTIDQCEIHSIPLQDCAVGNLYCLDSYDFRENEIVKLPVNPKTGAPIVFVPKRWLRFTPWISFENYFKTYCPQDEIVNPGETLDRVKVLNFNRHNYGLVNSYIAAKERKSKDCCNDPLFKQIPILSAKRKMTTIKKILTGNKDKADKKYEDAIVTLLASIFYPHLDFAADQVRTDSGVSIRDLVFYNTRKGSFLEDMSTQFNSRQIVFEMKNVQEINREHIFQLNRYMTDELGKFGVLVTRNPLKKVRRRNLVDLWSGQRKCIVALTDADIELMVDLYENKQRDPIDVLQMKYVEFMRECPV
ncbi:hypothetical protein [Maridesulfovibrio sp.]|uniref:hypothetical protein n=1 Tax=Maridesulfovibrio sp. TaxID=2795000 RepID=UPI0029CA2594|nr:hypothetical protein [Maridesulfovibrio sp.]